MIRRLLLVLLVAVPLQVYAGVHIAGSAIANSGTSGVNSISTTAINTTGANFCIVEATQNGGSGTLSVADSASNTWYALSGSPFSNTSGGNTYVWWAKNVTTSASHVANITGASFSGLTASMDCFSGESTTSPIRNLSYNVNTSYTASQPGAATTASASDDIWAVGAYQTSGVTTNFTSYLYTLSAQVNGTGSNFFFPTFTQYSTNVTSGTYTSSWSTSIGGLYINSTSIIVDIAPATATANTPLFLIQPYAGAGSVPVSGGGGGPTLLAYLNGAGPSTYTLSGQYLDIFSSNPWDAISNYKSNWASGITVSSNISGHVFDTGVLPAIIGDFAIIGPQCSAVDGSHWNYNTSPNVSGCWSGANAAPYDWCSLAQQVNASQSILYLVLQPANPGFGINAGNDPWLPSNSVLTTGTSVQNQLFAWMDSYPTTATSVTACLKTLTKPFIIAPTGELNLVGSGSLQATGPNSFLGVGASSYQTSAGVAQFMQIMQQHLVSQGVKNFIYTFETNLGQGNTYCYGMLSDQTCNTGTSPVFDVIDIDTNGNWLDSTAVTQLPKPGLPIGWGSMAWLSSGYPSNYSINTYSYSGPNIAGNPTVGTQGILTYYPFLKFTIDWFQGGNPYYLQCGVGQSLGVLSTSFVTGTVSCSGDPTSLSGDPWVSAPHNPTSFSKAGGLAGGLRPGPELPHLHGRAANDDYFDLLMTGTRMY